MIDFRGSKFLMIIAAVLVVCGWSGAGPSTAYGEPVSRQKKKVSAKPTPAATPDAIIPTAPAAPTAPAQSAAPNMPPLTAEEMTTAVSLESISIPTPGELFAALNKQCKPNWTAQARGPMKTAYSDRAQAALNLGGLIADGYVAVEAADGQQVKNLGRDILALSRNLGISKGILDRGESIKRLSDENDWNALKEDLEAMQDEVKQEMDALHDDDLITLLSVGAWIRGTYVVSDVVLKNFGQNTSCILRQPALVNYLRSKLDTLSPKLKSTPLMQNVEAGLMNLGKLVSFPLGDTASQEDVQKLHDQAGELLKAIAKKES